MAPKKKLVSAKPGPASVAAPAAPALPDGPAPDEASGDGEPAASRSAASGSDRPAAASSAVEVAAARPASRTAAPAVAAPSASSDGLVRTTQALIHGAAASGARFVRPGFATTPAGDLAFALGFPHLEYIIDDHPDGARAEMVAYERKPYRLGWPRNVAIRWCRITACKGFKRTPQGATELDAAGKKAIKNGA